MPYNFDGPNDLYGVFNEEKSIYIGDPYDKGYTGLSRHKGKQFSAPYQPKGRGVDAMIDKSTPLTIPGDVYVEPYSLQKDLSQRSNQLHSKPFVPVGGTKKPSGSGSLWGVFGRPGELLDTDASLGANSGRPRLTSADHKKNIYVNPPKKGSFGFPVQDRTIGQNKFEFIPDEYCRGRILEKEMKREARAKIPKPFVSSGRTGKGLTAITPLGGGSPTPPPPRASSAPPGRKPWRANNPPQKGQGYGTISRIPYVPDPIREPQYTKRGASARSFKPTGSYPHNRLSMWSPNPYAYMARPPPDNDMSLLG